MKKVHNSIRTKRIVCLMLSVILLVCLLSACGGDNKTDEDATANVESELSNDVISIDGIYIDNENQKGVIGICDINIVKDIMEYLEKHMNELDELCTQCDWSGRQEEN